ncbi:uncharacterized protein LOC126367727 isoform X1 [Pectinophora gossypiella]|uniref:uncharacterized protein LOC126367727 isoform X1 n=1 Tax=Pectinophora gossypiella TaxID=13191 RepID=UPI00214F4FE7|nr:uncharacterized protein LOC126367727 isoform X1 [Pectinophora gossypiella]
MYIFVYVRASSRSAAPVPLTSAPAPDDTASYIQLSTEQTTSAGRDRVQVEVRRARRARLPAASSPAPAAGAGDHAERCAAPVVDDRWRCEDEVDGAVGAVTDAAAGGHSPPDAEDDIEKKHGLSVWKNIDGYSDEIDDEGEISLR